MRKLYLKSFVVICTIIFCGTTESYGLINPRFRPNDLIEQSDNIFEVLLNKPDAAQIITLTIKNALKGEKLGKKPTINLASAAQPEWAAKIGEIAAARGDSPVLMFIGKRKQEGQGDEEAVKGAVLQIDRLWVVLDEGENGVWNMIKVDDTLQGTWDGGSDTLTRLVKHVIEHPDDLVPVEIGCNWESKLELGKCEGKVTGCQAVRLPGIESAVLHIASPIGDKLYAWDAKKGAFENLDTSRELTAKSEVCAWGDFNGDGKLDLASWNRKDFDIFYGTDAKTLKNEKLQIDLKLLSDNKIISMISCDAGVDKKAGLIIGTEKSLPILLRPQDGTFVVSTLSGPSDDLGKASQCLYADFNSDGFADILQPREKGSVIFKGKGKGLFEDGCVISNMATKGPSVATACDFDEDGLLDIFMIGPEICQLWNNRGSFIFAETFNFSGEMSYTAQPSLAIATAYCDINNDGLVDLFIAFSDEHPHLYFNRGFRSFGKALSMVWENGDFTSATESGQQAAAVADFNGDGAEDFALINKDGTIQLWIRSPENDSGAEPRGLRVALPAENGLNDPVLVEGWSDLRYLGARSIESGNSGAIFGLAEPGATKIKWKIGDNKAREKKNTIENRVKTLMID